ncbi:hypothetical protein QCA50_006349 [Cerrena zonata]|uniref:Major facilitator superfamily MFS-1 n=1 Tax=Cerrena zonata TaxID=2478898 RepID=A0AAW0GKT3_9APHY
MSATNRTSTIPRRVFGNANESALDDELSSNPPNPSRRPSGLGSFARAHRPSFVARWRNREGEEDESAVVESPSMKPPIPSALQPPPEVYATPLPTLSMIVLSITMLGEFLSANVSAPFLLFMVEGFNQFTDEADVGKWTGILVSTFFLTQFITSLLWATVAAKHSPRLVLSISLLGSAVTCCLFGTATSLQQAMAIRLMQGIFAGAIGVARGAVTSVTDPSNEGRAYAILGFCWGFGGVSGAIVGGTFENPAKKWPSAFAHIPLFVNYPYLLPCAVAASVTFTGSILSLFLGPDCGPREGAIRLPIEKTTSTSATAEESRPTTPVSFGEPSEQRGMVRRLSNKLSGYFSRRTQEEETQTPPVQLAPAPSQPKGRTFSRTSRADGSAYGYNGSFRHRLYSNMSARTRRGSAATTRRRGSNTGEASGLPSSVATGSDMNFAQRLLMANELQVTNIADLWVASATAISNEDYEDPFESDEDEDNEVGNLDDIQEGDIFATPSIAGSRPNRFSRRLDSRATIGSKRPSFAGLRPSIPSLGSPRRPSSSQPRVSSGARHVSDDPRRPSMTPSMLVPPIFSHVGVRTPLAVLEAQQLLAMGDEEEGLAPIQESRARSESDEIVEPEPSLMSQLPILVIIQYGLLALHSTTHDQVFYLYLVSKYSSGGLNLNAGHFSQLIALMCLAQIVYQFYFYPCVLFLF